MCCFDHDELDDFVGLVAREVLDVDTEDAGAGGRSTLFADFFKQGLEMKGEAMADTFVNSLESCGVNEDLDDADAGVPVNADMGDTLDMVIFFSGCALSAVALFSGKHISFLLSTKKSSVDKECEIM